MYVFGVTVVLYSEEIRNYKSYGGVIFDFIQNTTIFVDNTLHLLKILY